MKDVTLNISVDKIIELVLAEQKADIKKHLLTTVGQPGADLVDSYVPNPSGILSVLKSLNE
jgi:hypothetical protein